MKKPIAFCFDLDGTVTQDEILPIIAKEAGIQEEIKILTQITLNGLIPFENSFKLRVKLLTSILISKVSSIVIKTRLDPNIKEFIQSNSENCFIVTGNLDVWVKSLIENELGCQYFASTAQYDGDKLLGISKILNKGKAIDTLKQDFKKIVTIGDSMNDCSMFEKADIQIAFGGVHSPTNTLVQLSKYVVFDGKGLVNLLNLIQENEG